MRSSRRILGRSGVLAGALLVVGIVSLAAPVAASGQCAVTIAPAVPTPDGDAAEEVADENLTVMNVAEHAAFTAVTASPASYRWTIDGTVIRDYTDKSSTGFGTTGPPDLTARTVDFYWGRQTGARTLRVAVIDTAGRQCTATATITVQRSTSADRLAEHWWLTNHDKEVSDEHAGWHMRDMEANKPACPPGVHTGPSDPCYGKTFFDFHRTFMLAFSQFRAFFGYPPIGPPYDPATPIPTGPGIDHPDRATNTPTCGGTCAIPPEFTATGTRPHVPYNTTGSLAGGCDVPMNPEPRKLSDWPPDQNALACAVTEPWHNDVHGSIGDDMAYAQFAPRDPIFWRWHRYVEEISAARSRTAPPQTSLIFPSYTYPWIAALPEVRITYDKPVSGIAPGELRVDGQPATHVTGSGAGPYTFTGYPTPADGIINVTLAGVFPETWSYDKLNPDAMVPGDTLTVGRKLALSLNPTRADSGEDGIPDGFKLAYPCTQVDAYVNVDGPMLTNGGMAPPVRDVRGQSLHVDYENHTNPCA